MPVPIHSSHNHAEVEHNYDERDEDARIMPEPVPFEDFLIFKNKFSFGCLFHQLEFKQANGKQGLFDYPKLPAHK